MRLTTRDLNRATLARQLLLRREPLPVAEAVRRVVALQAQEAASPYLALWNRVDPFDPAELDAAFADHRVVKATLMRLTLHAVAAEDYPAFQAAVLRSLRGGRLGDARFLDTGLTPADADALVPHLTRFTARPRSRPEVEAMLAERVGAEHPRLWWALRHYAPIWHAPTGGPWSFGVRAAYLAAGVRPDWADQDGALRTLVRRYLAGFGPATVADVAQFAMVPRARVRAAVAELGDELETLPGSALLDVPGAPRPGGDTPAPPRLLGMWDSILLGYADRGRVIPEAHRKVAIRNNGDVLPTLLVDGFVAGVWRPVEGGIEATAFEPLPAEAWDGLAAEARRLVPFLAGRDPGVYGRYAHWWAKLPPGDTRVLTG